MAFKERLHPRDGRGRFTFKSNKKRGRNQRPRFQRDRKPAKSKILKKDFGAGWKGRGRS